MSSNVTHEPVRVRMLAQDFVLFRSSDGRAHCLSNTCIHRGASLCDGEVLGDVIECPYHGWLFGADGKCTFIPALDRNEGIPSRARVDAYPVEERYGLVFVFLGDLPAEERPPIMEVKEWDDPGYRYIHHNLTLHANFRRSVENGIDVAHTEFVHSDLMGYRGKERVTGRYRAPQYEVNATEWGASTGKVTFPPAPGWNPIYNFIMKKGTLDKGPVVETGYHGPTSLRTSIMIGNGFHAPQYFFETPIDECQTRIYVLLGRGFFRWKFFDGRYLQRNQRVVDQDTRIVEGVDPVLPPEKSDEFFVEPDAIIEHYHRSLDNWTARGWQIDSLKAADVRKEQQNFVIPSPARRESKSWCRPTVPVISAES